MELTALDYMILIVKDLDRALHFYTGVLGLRLGHRSGDYAQLDTGATRLALYTRIAMAKTLGMSLDVPAANAPGFEMSASSLVGNMPPSSRATSIIELSRVVF